MNDERATPPDDDVEGHARMIGNVNETVVEEEDDKAVEDVEGYAAGFNVNETVVEEEGDEGVDDVEAHALTLNVNETVVDEGVEDADAKS